MTDKSKNMTGGVVLKWGMCAIGFSNGEFWQWQQAHNINVTQRTGCVSGKGKSSATAKNYE